jgi:zinc carboxypeptidase
MIRRIMRKRSPLFVALALAVPIALVAQSRATIPTPESVFGFAPGADQKLATYDQVLSYFKQVATAAPNRVRLVEAGTTTQGRTFYFALVSSPANLENIDRLREIARRLAHPAGMTDDEARKLAREGKAFVHIDGGLHSSEVAGGQHIPMLLETIIRNAEEPAMRTMLDNVVLMLWPTINPDGQQMVTEWHMKHATTPDATVPQLPELYQEYVGHDNNRDAYMLDMIESRAVEQTWRAWEPTIIYVHHQSAPFPTRIWLPPFAEPIATHAPYLLSREVNMIGMAIAAGLEERGQVGATHMGSGYDAWYPGYIDYLPMFKNIAAFWTETQGNGAAPRTSQPDQIQPDMRRPQSLYSSPWLGGTWRLRDAVEYMHTASLSVLEFASRYKESLLYNRYQAGRDQIRKGRSEAPYGYVVPQDQRDPVAAVELLRRLAFSGVRVMQLESAATIGDASYPAGTWIVPTDQEFAALAREVLDVQKYPEIRESPNGPLDQPYDAAGWTLPFAMGVNVVPISTPIADEIRSRMRPLGPAPDAKAKPVPYVSTRIDAAPFDSVPGIGFDSNPNAVAIVPPAGKITGSGASLAVNPAQNNAYRAINRAWRGGLEVQFVAGANPSASRYVINGLTPNDQNQLVTSLALSAERTTAKGTAVVRPRVALFRPASPSMDEGWTRWVLEQYGFDFVRVTQADIQSGMLRDKFDVLILTNDGSVLDTPGRGGGQGGGAAGGAPAGRGGAAPQATANNEARVRAIDDFVNGGGTLICFNRASTFAIDQLKLPVKNATTGLGRQDFFVGGSLLQVTTDPSQRVMTGMGPTAAVFFDSGPVFETLEGFKGAVLARYANEGTPLLSGFLLGEKYLQGKAAALDVELGAGRVVLLGFRPQWRGQPFGTFRVIFNAILMGRAI